MTTLQIPEEKNRFNFMDQNIRERLQHQSKNEHLVTPLISVSFRTDVSQPAFEVREGTNSETMLKIKPKPYNFNSKPRFSLK